MDSVLVKVLVTAMGVVTIGVRISVVPEDE